MALTAEKPAEEKEVFVQTPVALRGETCEACGSNAVPARYHAVKGDKELYFCAHHIRKHHAKLVEQKFIVYPEDISYTAGVVK